VVPQVWRVPGPGEELMWLAGGSNEPNTPNFRSKHRHRAPAERRRAALSSERRAGEHLRTGPAATPSCTPPGVAAILVPEFLRNLDTRLRARSSSSLCHRRRLLVSFFYLEALRPSQLPTARPFFHIAPSHLFPQRLLPAMAEDMSAEVLARFEELSLLEAEFEEAELEMSMCHHFVTK
jgi:hypothetical protein